MEAILNSSSKYSFLQNNTKLLFMCLKHTFQKFRSGQFWFYSNHTSLAILKPISEK
jgi:hypothetical protein